MDTSLIHFWWFSRIQWFEQTAHGRANEATQSRPAERLFLGGTEDRFRNVLLLPIPAFVRVSRNARKKNWDGRDRHAFGHQTMADYLRRTFDLQVT
jgi:hypothetical protein